MKRGRRTKGSGNTREGILRAAVALFADRGYDATTVRAIATEADVDPALVYHYFRDKEGLFRDVVQSRMRPSEAAELEAFRAPTSPGEGVARLFLEQWGGDRGATSFLALMRSATSNPEAAAMFRALIEKEVPPRLSGLVAPRQVAQTVALVASQLIGLGTVRYVLRLEPVASMPLPELARLIGPTIDRYLSPRQR